MTTFEKVQCIEAKTQTDLLANIARSLGMLVGNTQQPGQFFNIKKIMDKREEHIDNEVRTRL